MKMLLFGADGQLGWQLRRSLAPLGELWALTRARDAGADLTQPAAVAQAVRELRPDVIVNAAGFTDVDGAESDPQAAFAVNAAACELLAREASRCGAWLVHFSTDYVFDGSGTRPWREDDAAEPVNVYGRSKLAGEEAIRREGGNHLILRSGWLFDTWGDNFVKSVLGAARRESRLRVVDDQWGAPTRAAWLADVTAHLLRHAGAQPSGVYHVSSAGETSWHGVAVHALACAQAQGLQLRAGPADVHAIQSSQLGRPANRPANSRLDCGRLHEQFGLALPAWQQGVAAVVWELAGAWNGR
jgi:dTDP-4-dehydrorhamnose reductase